MENMVRVIDIPPDTTAEQAEELLNLPFEEGYHLTAILAWDRFGARAFYRRRVRAAPSGKTGGNQANRDGQDAAAKAVIRAHADMTVPALIAKLKDVGIVRKQTWVTYARLDIRGNNVKRVDA
jgi:hypothetical protein